MAEVDASEEEYDRRVRALVASDTHAVVKGGAGAGKTTAALGKAVARVNAGLQYRHSKVLFLSFANTTIDRVTEQALKLATASQRESIETSTYHGFAWSILKSHSYLIGAPRSTHIMGTGEENSFRSQAGSSSVDLDAEFHRLYINYGEVAFDYFANLANEILEGNPALVRAYTAAYPLIILDEFQDTSEGQWALVQTLGRGSQLVALGDPKQRIYEFAGASPKRFTEFVDVFEPTEIDLSAWNWRSPEGSIAQFGDDMIAGRLKGDYPNVHVVFTNHPPLMRLKTEVMAGMKRLRKLGRSGTIAILTPSNSLSGTVYDYFRAETPPLPALSLDIHAGKGEAYAATVFICATLEVTDSSDGSVALLSRALARYARTKSATRTVTARAEAEKLEKEAARLESGEGGRELKSTKELRAFLATCTTRGRTGHPFADYLSTITAAASSTSKILTDLAKQTRLVNLLTRGSALEIALANSWRGSATYVGAAEFGLAAVTTQQMYSSKAGSRNLVVMNIHRAKGKEFDEVFLYEERWVPFVRDSETDFTNARLAFNVAVTRARQRVTILTPKARPSRLITESLPPDLSL